MSASSIASESLSVVYREANEAHNVDLVRQLNEQGMKPSVPLFSGPTIISPFMDIATKYDIILNFFKELKASGHLLTESEFDRQKLWKKKDDLSRILGHHHLEKIIAEENLKHIKVPQKIAVVNDGVEAIKVLGWCYDDNLYQIRSDQIKVYAKKIQSVNRKLSREEIDELIQVVAKSNFTDMWPENIIVAEDGIYFIDTEFKSFKGSLQWEKMHRFSILVKEEDREYFANVIEEKINQPRVAKKDYGYHYLKMKLSIIKECLEEHPNKADRFQSRIDEINHLISNLKLVGASKAGSWHIEPNEFTINLASLEAESKIYTKSSLADLL